MAFRLAFFICAVCFAGSAVTAELTDNPDVKILYLEPVAPLSIAASDTARKTTRPSASPEIAFDAFGKRFALALTTNADLKPAADSSLTLYRGELRGIAGSWVRIGAQGQEWRGMMWDGNELYVIESVERVRDAASKAANVPASGPVIFRLSDTEVNLGRDYCGTAPEAPEETGLQLYKSIANEIRLARKPNATKRLEVSVVGDSIYTARYSSASEAQDEALVRLNNVDGIFSDQLGVEIHVQSVRIESSTTNSFSSTTDPTSLLGELSRMRERSSSLSSAGLTHLLTGRDLDGQTVGIAYIGAVCSTRYGVGLAEIRGRGAWTESLISAHEMGHSFGAIHDGEGECSATPQTFLMAPRVNGSSTFSECSLSHIQPVLQSASCLASVPHADLSVAANLGEKDVVLGQSIDWDIAVTNAASGTATGGHLSLTLDQAGSIQNASGSGMTCTLTTSSVDCSLADLPGNTTRTLRVTMRGDSAAIGHVAVNVSADNDSVGDNDSGTGTLNVQASVTQTTNLDNSSTSNNTPAATPPTTQSSGGGGGATDLACLAALLGLGLIRRRAS